jgi:hypothetical protein
MVRQTIERASREGEDFEHHYRLLMPDGSVKGGIEFIGAVKDQTATRQAEEALRRSGQQRRDAVPLRPTEQ